MAVYVPLIGCRRFTGFEPELALPRSNCSCVIVAPLNVGVVRKLVGVLTVNVSVVIVAPTVSPDVMLMSWPFGPTPANVWGTPNVAVNFGVSRKPVEEPLAYPEMSKLNVSAGATRLAFWAGASVMIVSA